MTPSPTQLATAAAMWATLSTVLHAAAPPADDWPRYGHDGALTGRSALSGRIVNPTTAWTFQTGGRRWVIEILPSTGRHDLQLDAGVSPTLAPAKVRPPAAPTIDLDGSGTLRPLNESYHERWAKILPEVKGWQRVAWNETWTDQKVCRLQLFAYDQGFSHPRLVWQTDPPEGTVFQPLDIVCDLDGDGRQEICVAAHYRVMLFDGVTGRKETELRYHQSRPYGWFGLANVDATGPMELITIGDFQSHIDVLNYQPSKPEQERLSVRWRRDIETAIEERTKWPQVGPRPLVDVQGDAKLELVFNLFNDTGDGQWHAVVWDASTGTLVRDFARRFVQGTADIDRDGKAELFLIETDGVLVPTFGRVELIGFHSAEPVGRWSQQNASWGCADVPRLGTNWSTSAAQGMRDLLVTQTSDSATPMFLVAQRAAASAAPFATTLRAMSAGTDGLLQTNWQLMGLVGDFQLLALSSSRDHPGAAVSVRMDVARDTKLVLTGDNAAAQLTENHPLGVTVSTPIAARLHPEEKPAIVVEGAAQEIFALQVGKSATNPPQVLWRRPGRGMGDGSRWLGPLAADLDGDGGNEVLVATADSVGRAALTAYQQDGSVFWQAPFPQTPGATPVWNAGALTFWWPGHFRTNAPFDKLRAGPFDRLRAGPFDTLRPGDAFDKRKAKPVDLFVNTRQGPMHSDVGQLLDGRTGALLWKKERATIPGQFTWGYAGIPPAVADLDADDLEELISLYPVCFWVADGRTGQLRHGVELASRKRIPAWAAYGEPIIHPFLSKNSPQVLLDSQYVLALLDSNGAPLWHAGVRPDFPTATASSNQTSNQPTSVKHALVDFDGDGVFEIASAGYGDGVRAIEPRTGKTLWVLSAPMPTCPKVAAANIDGRKGDEMLYVAGARLIAITGDRASGRILWEWRGPANLSMPAIADVDGDGFAELIVQAADGSVSCINNRNGP